MQIFDMLSDPRTCRIILLRITVFTWRWWCLFKHVARISTRGWSVQMVSLTFKSNGEVITESFHSISTQVFHWANKDVHWSSSGGGSSIVEKISHLNRIQKCEKKNENNKTLRLMSWLPHFSPWSGRARRSVDWIKN